MMFDLQHRIISSCNTTHLYATALQIAKWCAISVPMLRGNMPIIFSECSSTYPKFILIGQVRCTDTSYVNFDLVLVSYKAIANVQRY
ncbi:hypothetical protein XFLM_09975 [Xylella fastidiosa subsp. fastidiosa GB514]|nr:hypothetical protein XFLM_09975 [Xylella fastidiosa subsp. fastidiosa GB514]SHG88407.1 hypothetical protein SAMN05660380_01662 [Xylella fastidiosa]